MTAPTPSAEQEAVERNTADWPELHTDENDPRLLSIVDCIDRLQEKARKSTYGLDPNTVSTRVLRELLRGYHNAEKFKDQVRDTCARAETAEAQLADAKAKVAVLPSGNPAAADRIDARLTEIREREKPEFYEPGDIQMALFEVEHIEALVADLTSYKAAYASTDRIKTAIDRALSIMTDRANLAESTNAKLLARVGELEKGLKEFCDGHCVFSDNNPPMITSVMDAVNGPTYVTYGTRMNKARALLQPKPEGEGK